MIETILTEWEDIAEDGGLAARQNGKLLNFGFGVFKGVFGMKDAEVKKLLYQDSERDKRRPLPLY